MTTTTATKGRKRRNPHQQPTSLGLTVDWDFFFDYRPPKGQPQRFDWGHNETDLFVTTLWGIRAQMDPTLQDDFVPAGDIFPFWGMLEQMGYQMDRATQFAIGDSHLWALDWLAGCDRIVNFDNHHDLGYGSEARTRLYWDTQIARAITTGKSQPDCGNWLGLHMAVYGSSVEIVYPSWGIELPDGGRPGLACGEAQMTFWQQRMKRELGFGVYPNGADRRGQPVHVDKLYIARSGGWTPPWADEAFEAWAGACPAGRRVPGLSDKRYPLQTRTWERVTAPAEWARRGMTVCLTQDVGVENPASDAELIAMEEAERNA